MADTPVLSPAAASVVDGVDAPQPFGVHPLRRELCDEVHARPFPVVRAPLRVSHLAVLAGERSKAEEIEHLRSLCERYGAPPPDDGTSFYTGNFGDFELRWERHTEFYTYSVFRPGAFDRPFADPAIALIPRDWLSALRGQVVAMLHVDLESADTPARSRDDLHELFEQHRLIGSEVVEHDATVWTAFRVHSDGFGRVYIQDHSLNDCRAGRLIQRLLELEVYRLMALLALPLARELGPKITRMDQDLAAMIESLARFDGVDSERRLLHDLSCIAATVENARARTNYRFSATRAYDALIRRRFEELRETQIAGVQTVAEFLDRRMSPAMRTCEAVSRRLEDLSLRIDQASDLLRTRIDMTLRTQNQEVLASMDRRAHQQLRLQQTVEGLSIAAVTYYVLGLVKYGAEALRQMGVPVEANLAVGVMLPVVLLLVWWGIRRIHRSIDHHGRPETGAQSEERITSNARAASVSTSSDAAGNQVTPR